MDLFHHLLYQHKNPNEYLAVIDHNWLLRSIGLKEDLKYAENTEVLTPEELKEFEEEVAPLGKDFCRRCSYCLPCPNDILIPIMINVLYPQVKGRKYDDLPDKQQRMGKNLMIWWQACEECGQCEEKCPYNLPIIKRKNELIEMFSR